MSTLTSIVNIIQNIPQIVKKFLIKLQNILFNFFTNFPEHVKSFVEYVSKYLENTRYKISNIVKINIQLGKYHIYQGNFSDALLRFNIVKNFLEKDNKDAIYLSAWTHFMMNEHESALELLNNASSADILNLAYFIKHHKKYDQIPAKILLQHKKFYSKKYIEYATNNKLNLVDSVCSFVKSEFGDILQDREGKALELGGWGGVFVQELKTAVSIKANFALVEEAQECIDVCNAKSIEGKKLYNIIIKTSLENFFNSDQASANTNYSSFCENFSFIISILQIGYKKDIVGIVKKLYDMLLFDGGCILSFFVSDETFVSLDLKSFVFKDQELCDIFLQNKFLIKNKIIIKSNSQNKHQAQNNIAIYALSKR